MLKVHKLEDENKALKKQLGMPNGESLTASSDDNVFTAKVTNVWAQLLLGVDTHIVK